MTAPTVTRAMRVALTRAGWLGTWTAAALAFFSAGPVLLTLGVPLPVMVLAGTAVMVAAVAVSLVGSCRPALDRRVRAAAWAVVGVADVLVVGYAVSLDRLGWLWFHGAVPSELADVGEFALIAAAMMLTVAVWVRVRDRYGLAMPQAKRGRRR